MKKKPTVKDLKAYAFDTMQRIKQLEQEYNATVQAISQKQQDPKEEVKEKKEKK